MPHGVPTVDNFTVYWNTLTDLTTHSIDFDLLSLVLNLFVLDFCKESKNPAESVRASAILKVRIQNRSLTLMMINGSDY